MIRPPLLDARAFPIQQRHQVLHEGAVLLRYEGGQAGFSGVMVSQVSEAKDGLQVLAKGRPIDQVISGGTGQEAPHVGFEGSVCVHSGFFIGLPWQSARQVMADCLEREGLALGKATARSGTGCFPAGATGKSPSPSSAAPGAARCPLGKKTCRRNCLMRRMMRPLLFKCPLSAGSKGGEPTSAAKIISNI